MDNALRGTTLPDQRDRLGVSTEQMGILFSASSLVNLISSLINGIMADVFQKKAMLFISIYLFIGSIFLMAIKFLLSYYIYFVLYLTYMFCLNACDVIGNIIILRIWGSRATGPLYAIHMGYYIGGTIGPFLARPFLSPEDILQNCTDSNVTNYISSQRYPEGSRIQIPFLVPGILLIGTSFCFLMFHCFHPSITSQKGKLSSNKTGFSKEIFNPKTCAHGSMMTTIFFLITLPLYFFLHIARAIPLDNYLYTYATESDLGIEKEQAAVIDGIFYFFGLLGRLLSTIVSRWLPVQVTFNLNITVVTITLIYMALWGKDQQVGFVVCAWITSLFSSPTWPGCIAWTDKYIIMTGMAYFLVPFGANVGAMIFQPIYSGSFDKDQPEIIMYGGAIFGILTFMVVVVRQIVGVVHGSRFPTAAVKDDLENLDIVVISYNEQEDFYNRNNI